ncbi:MAG: cyanophycinase [Arenicellales bacterium]|nr:cyanophycinase [Arenicellales bacterium]
MKLSQKHFGRLAIIGGRLEPDNEPIYERMRSLCNHRIAVIPVASDVPQEVGVEAVDGFRDNGIQAELVPLYWGDWRAPFSQDVVQLIESYGSVFFTGGDQARIIDCLITQGQETPALQAIRRLYKSGGLVAGSSAGAAIMSSRMILGGTSGEALSFGQVDDRDAAGLVLGQGLGFFPWGIVDQHFIARGRIGRLVVAVCSTTDLYGFGIDENTALFVDGTQALVRGETGVVVVDRKAAKVDLAHSIENINISFLDDGDGYDLQYHKAIPHGAKKRIRVTKSSYQRPAPLKRCAFGSYTLHDLMLRLAKSNPAYYLKDSASSWPDKSDIEWCVEVERLPRHSRALYAIEKGKMRYTLLDFHLHIRRSAEHAIEHVRTPINASHLDQPPQSHLVLLGNTPLEWHSEHVKVLKPYLVEPVGVIATASARPRQIALEYIDWLRGLNLKAVELFINETNIERRNVDRMFLRSISRFGSVLVAGGNQRRLTQTLTYRGEVTPVLQSLFDAFESETNLIAVGGAAAAFGTRMIADGDSFAALRFGSSDDAGSRGMVMEQGLGLFESGIVDQNFLQRGRLGRLLVACAEERAPFGFGLCEESGLIVAGDSTHLRAIGAQGFVVVAMHNAGLSIGGDAFSANDVELQLVPPGASFDVATRVTINGGQEKATAVVEKMVSHLADECNGMLKQGNGLDQGAWLNLAFTQGSPAKLDIESRRFRY